jgi:hypothetical protein
MGTGISSSISVLPSEYNSTNAPYSLMCNRRYTISPINGVDKQPTKNSLHLKPTHALISKHTFTFTFIKTLKFAKMFYKSVVKTPTCFGPYSMTIFKGRPSYLVHLPPFGCLPRHLSFRCVAVCFLCDIRPHTEDKWRSRQPKGGKCTKYEVRRLKMVIE